VATSPLLLLAATRHFETVMLVFGALLVGAALLSGIARRSFLSLTALFVLIGFLLGDGGTGTLHFDARSPFVADLAVIALIVILFRDGLEVEGEMLQAHWHLPLRKLVLAMPLTALIVALGARLLTSLSWTECFLLGALLSPTDPVLSSSVVTNSRVPRVIRHSLNLESGLNDGLALPAVLALAAALTIGMGHFVWWRFVLEDVTIGLAVFVAAITLGIQRPDLRLYFQSQAEDLVEIVKLGIFVVFGSLLTLHGLFGDGWAAVGIVVIALLLARPIAVFLALTGTATDMTTRGFMAWFGPKGVATMTFALLVLSDRISAGTRIFNIAALVVFCSIIAHGLSDTPAAEWLARRYQHDGGEAAHGVRRGPEHSAVVAPGVDHPADQYQEQEEGDESADQRPVHGA
jgi:NhaP-type Na+/H+ or K+/H+ antiporter